MSRDDHDRRRLDAMAAASVARGRAVFHLDLAAALATDHMRATFHDPAALGLRDWIVDVGANGHEVLFLTADDRPHVRFRVTFAADGRPLGERINEAASQRVSVMAMARKTALAHGVEAGRSGYTPVVMPVLQDAAADATIEVYLLRGAPMRGDIAIGVHWRVRVSSDGARVLDTDPLSGSDLTLLGSNGEPPEDIVLKHLLSEAPTEVHVYLSLKHGRPMDIVSVPSNTHWRVDGAEVVLLRFLQAEHVWVG